MGKLIHYWCHYIDIWLN